MVFVVGAALATLVTLMEIISDALRSHPRFFKFDIGESESALIEEKNQN